MEYSKEIPIFISMKYGWRKAIEYNEHIAAVKKDIADILKHDESAYIKVIEKLEGIL